MNDVPDLGVHFLSLGRDRFFKRVDFSTATGVSNNVGGFKHRWGALGPGSGLRPWGGPYENCFTLSETSGMGL